MKGDEMSKEDLKKVVDHLGDMQGFLVGLYTFGVIPKTHPFWNMLDEMAKKNKKVRDGLQAKIGAEA